MTRRATCAAIAVMSGILAVGCSHGGSSASSRTAFIEAQAAALCSVRDHKFHDQRAMAAAYTAAERTAGVDAADSARLTSELQQNADLRQAVSERVAQRCP